MRPPPDPWVTAVGEGDGEGVPNSAVCITAGSIRARGPPGRANSAKSGDALPVSVQLLQPAGVEDGSSDGLPVRGLAVAAVAPPGLVYCRAGVLGGLLLLPVVGCSSRLLLVAATAATARLMPAAQCACLSAAGEGVSPCLPLMLPLALNRLSLTGLRSVVCDAPAPVRGSTPNAASTSWPAAWASACAPACVHGLQVPLEVPMGVMWSGFSIPRMLWMHCSPCRRCMEHALLVMVVVVLVVGEAVIGLVP